MKEALRAIAFFFLVAFILTLLFFPAAGLAQEQPANIGVFGLGYSGDGAPGLLGFSAYGRLVAARTAIFTDYEILRADEKDAMLSVAGFRLKYSIRTGIAQQLVQITPSWSVWGLFNGGLAADGQTVVRSFQFGGFIDKDIGKGMGVMLILAAEDNPITGRNFAPRAGWRFKF